MCNPSGAQNKKVLAISETLPNLATMPSDRALIHCLSNVLFPVGEKYAPQLAGSITAVTH